MRTALLVPLAAAPALAQPSFQGLAFLPTGSSYAEGFALSSDGSVAAGYNFAGTDREAVRWTPSGPVGLGDLNGVQYSSTAYALSASGSVAIGQCSAVFNGFPSFQAFRWENGTLTGLGSLGSSGGTGLPGSQAFGVSADGSIVVGFSTSPPGQSQEAFRWTAATGMQGLGDLPGAQFYSGAWGISADGQVIVGESFSGSGPQGEAFRWTAATGMVGLGDLPGGDFLSVAHAASADGSVIVGFGFSSAGRRPFRWQGGAMADLGDAPGGPTACIAYAVSADGSIIVGGGNTAAPGDHGAFIWDPVHGMRNLHTVLANDYGLAAAMAGWTLYSASAVSSGGQVILGNGLDPSGHRAVWLARLGAPDCYPNCDASTAAPVLNVSDFICFLNRFSAGDSYANCDGSTTPPTLNVSDFTCFLNRYAAGCP